MGIANIDALTAEVAALNEALRIKLVAKANIPLYSSGREAQLAKLNQEIATIKYDIATVNAKITGVSTPPVSEPVPPAVANKPSTNKLTGQADGDNSFDKNEAAKISANQSDPVPEMVITGDRPKNGTKLSDAPGARLQNPLGDFSSYTYQLTLYMITPDAYTAFVQSGRKNINAIYSTATDQAAAEVKESNSGAYIIAQSGGVNKEISNKAFNLDFYIDDVKIKSATSTQASGSATNVTEISFNIYEPYGFSFVTKLQRAQQFLQSTSKIKNYNTLTNETRQFFLLGVTFQGYDVNGNLMSSTDSSGNDNKFQRFYDLKIRSFKFKLDGHITVYNIVAASIAPTIAFGNMLGRVDAGFNVTAATVEQALGGLGPDGTGPAGDGVSGLFNVLNANQQLKAKVNPQTGIKGCKIPHVYKVRYIGDSAAISGASLISKANTDKTTSPMSNAKTTAQVNEATALKSSPDVTKKTLTFVKDIPIMQAIDNIIIQSNYISQALTVLNSNDADSQAESNKSPSTVLRWYNCSAEVVVLGFDDITSDFAYEITYIIQPYDTPYIPGSAYSKKTSKYAGPYKKYQYWFTGKNSEIISYTQQMDNTFFNVSDEATGTPQSHDGAMQNPNLTGKRTNQDRTGLLDTGLETQNNYRTSLYDKGSYANAKLVIMGDPDYLVQDSPGSINSLYNKFYGTDGYTINANGGQVFIEISFNEAEDYNLTTGLLSINESILFWEYPKDVAGKIKGISYQVKATTSIFSKGKFTQELECTMPGSFQDLSTKPGDRPTPTTTTDSDIRTSELGAFEGIEAGQSALDESGRATSATDTRLTTYNQGTSPTGPSPVNKEVQDDEKSPTPTKNVSNNSDAAGREIANAALSARARDNAATNAQVRLLGLGNRPRGGA